MYDPHFFNRRERRLQLYGCKDIENDRQQYVVLMEPNAVTDFALFHGKLYIDAERLSFTRIELDLDMSD